MKKFAVLGTLLTIFGSAQLSAALLVEETFDYTPIGTSIQGKSGGVGFTNNWSFGKSSTGTMTITEKGVEVAGEKATWALRNVNISSANTPTLYFAYQLTSTASAVSSSSFTDAIVFRSGSTEVFWTGFNYSSGGPALKAKVQEANPTLRNNNLITLGTAYTVVGKFTFDDGNGNATLSIWVNPTDEGTPATYTKTWVSGITSITRIDLQRFDDNTKGAGSITLFDDIRIATDWDSALGISTIPESSTAALIVGGSALAVSALRRRRR